MDLHEQLDELARTADVPSGDLDAVVARGRHRQARTRRALGAAAVVALGATGLALVTTTGDDDGTELAAGEPGAVVEGDLAWQVVEPDSALALYGRPAVVGDGVVYALSTAPGQAPSDMVSPLQLWTSDDGVDWRTTSDGGPAGDLYLSDLDAGSDGRVYAIGTGQATAGTIDGRDIPELRIGSTADGESWSTEALDVDLASVLEHSTSFSWNQRDVATDAAGDVVAVVAMRAELDVPELVPDGDPAPERWAITPTGVDVLGERRDDAGCDGGEGKPTPSDEGAEGPHRVWPDYCGKEDRSYAVPPQETHTVERSYTWDELGVAGDLLAAALGRPIAFVAGDGGAFERVDVPLPAGEIGWLGLEGGAAGFDLALAPLGPDVATATALLHSEDGRTWTSAPLPAELQWINGMGTVAGQQALLGTGVDNRPVVVLGDGFVARPAADLDPALVGDRDVWAAGGAVGELGIAVVVGLADRAGNDVEYVLLTSRDGRSWTQHEVDEIAGVDVSMVGTPIVTGDRIVVPVVESGRRDAEGHLVQRALVATPA